MNQSESLSGVLSEFARTMVTDFPIQAILDHLVVRIVDALPITSAGVTLISPGRRPHHVAASDDAALRYEQLQSEVGEGPCTLAYELGAPVSVPDLASDPRFPLFAPMALAAGLGAVFTFPLRHGAERLGALDLYRESPGALDEETMISARTLADVAAAYLVNARAREEARNSSEQYRRSAMHDALTGLPNRVLFQERLEHAMLRARRSRKMLSILFLDLDRFKQVNDVHGHRTGDELLVAVGERLSGLVRPGDTVARMAGDEFVVMCEDLDDTGGTEALARRVVSSIGAPFALSTTNVHLTASVGIAFAGRGDHMPEQVLHDADQAMYRAKRAGGARHQLIDLRERFHGEQRTDLGLDLRGAAARGELRMEYQPIVRSDDGGITAVEALLRWDHPEHGAIAPTTTIPLAEQTHEIVELGRWVLEQACADRDRAQRAVPERQLGICVNVSPNQLLAAGFSRIVDEVLTASGTAPSLVTLELTERVFVDDAERALVVLDDLHRLGVSIALDDFGTGLSSLVHLRRFPIDVLKLDRSCTAGLRDDPAAVAVVAAVLGLAAGLGMQVVAEGVETADQLEQLSTLGCRSCQGYYFAPPMRVDDLERRLGLRGPEPVS